MNQQRESAQNTEPDGDAPPAAKGAEETPEQTAEERAAQDNQGQVSYTQGEDDPEKSEEAEEGLADDPRNDGSGFTIAIYSDPGRTSYKVRKLLEGDGEKWSRGATIQHTQILIPLREDGTLDLDRTLEWAQEDGAEISIVITEVPRTYRSNVKSAELHFQSKLGVISLPALGPMVVTASLRRELRRCVDALVYDSVGEAVEKGGAPLRHSDDDGVHAVYITPPWFVPGRTWCALGMMAANEPFWGLTKLSGMFAAAVATGAFGIFFSSIWEMADYLPTWRLAAVMVIAIGVVTTWLIVTNGLWKRSGQVGGHAEATMYNASTVLTILCSVASLYLMLFLGILSMGLVLIDPEFMTNTLRNDATLENYLAIAWLSASMGVVAGAIGSNFDDDDALRGITQGTREQQRYPKDEEQR